MADPEARRTDEGFTMMELMVVVILVSVLATVMVAVIAVILKNAPSAEVQADNARSYRGLTTWLPRDAASTPPKAFVFGTTSPTPTSPWSCSGISGPAIVQMSWSLDGTAYAAGYRLTAGGQRISRYACSGADTSTSLPNPTIRNVTNRLNTATAVPIDVEGNVIDVDGNVVGVRIQMTTCGRDADERVDCSVPGPVASVEASSHNPGPTNSLPPVPASP